MIKKIVFATNNHHKLTEVKALLGDKIGLLSLTDIGCVEEIEETGQTLEENAMIKAKYVYDKYGYPCFADDTGLEVEALNNAPGVYSARYAGEEKSSQANMEKLVGELKGVENRNARFRAVFAWIDDSGTELLSGEVKGVIVDDATGSNGFGYDPIFMPGGFTRTFAQLDATEKNMISHRGKAVEKLVDLFKSKGII